MKQPHAAFFPSHQLWNLKVQEKDAYKAKKVIFCLILQQHEHH